MSGEFYLMFIEHPSQEHIKLCFFVSFDIPMDLVWNCSYIMHYLTIPFADGREDNYIYVNEALLAGITVGAVEGIISTPFELFKLRAQVTSAFHFPTSSSVTKQSITPVKFLRGCTPDKKAWEHTIGLLSTLSTKHPNFVGALKEYPWMLTGSGRQPFAYEVKGPSNIISLEGWRVLWRGLRPGIVRDSVFCGIFFSSWQFIHLIMLDWKAVDMKPEPKPRFSSIFLSVA